MPFAGERSGLPDAAADAHLDAGDGRRARPGHTADDEVANGDVLPRRRLGDDRPYLL